MGRPRKTQTKLEKREYYKHPTFGHVYGVKLVTPVGRLSWPSLVTPREGMEVNGNPGTPRYELTLLLEEKNPKVKVFFERVERMAEEMCEVFNGVGESPLKKKKASRIDPEDLTFYKTDDEFDLDKYTYYKNQLIIVARNAERPNLISLDKTEKDEYVQLEPTKFIAGQLIRIVVTPIITVHGLSYKLNDVQFIRDDGVRFGGGGLIDSSGLLAETEDELLDEYLEEDADDDTLESAADIL